MGIAVLTTARTGHSHGLGQPFRYDRNRYHAINSGSLVRSLLSVADFPERGRNGWRRIEIEPMNWTQYREGVLVFSDAHFLHAQAFVFRKWCERAVERDAPVPTDLSGSCKYGSLFMQQVFGGAIRGQYQHQYNWIAGRVIDLSRDAADVAAMSRPYAHDADYFGLPRQQRSLIGCQPRVELWVQEFLREVEARATSV